MIEISSAIENRQFKLKDLEDKLKPIGYDIGGNWDYEHGYFDYKIDDNGSYVFLRLPFVAIDGEIGQKGVEVQLGRPFLLAHEYKKGLDDQVRGYNYLMNQFAEPSNTDAHIPEHIMSTGRTLIQELEATLIYF